MAATDDDGSAGARGTNEVHLVGRVAGEPDVRTLPSGDSVVLIRLVVDRPAGRVATPRAPSVDTIDCALWTSALRRRSGVLRPGAIVDVRGAVRRRFWRGAAGLPQSRYEVEVSAFRVLRAGPRPRVLGAAEDDDSG
jgi:single-strand DNA-binding protein